MTIEELTKVLEKSWAKETCSPGFREIWTKENPSLGQCAITALIVNDYFGGKIMRCMTSTGSHYYNEINGKRIDLTVDQFLGEVPLYEEGQERTRKYLLGNEDTKNRYLDLLKKVKVKIHMKRINSKLKKYIEQNIFPSYQKNDLGHNLDHILYVIERSLYFASTLDDINMDMVYTIAAYHDIGHYIDAKNHEKVSSIMLLADDHLKEFFDEEQIRIMADAVFDHRASMKGEPRSIYGKIVSSADRNTIVDLPLKRTYAYRINHNPNGSLETIIEESRQHIIDKFGKKGYATEKMYFDDPDYQRFLEEIATLASDPIEFRRRFIEVNDISNKKPEREKFLSSIYLIIKNDQGEVLLQRRQGTKLWPGYLALPAGHIDEGENAYDAAIREAKEELGIDIKIEDIIDSYVVNRTNKSLPPYYDVYFELSQYTGEIQIMEPEKCSELIWSDPMSLPEDMIDFEKEAMEQNEKGIKFSVTHADNEKKLIKR